MRLDTERLIQRLVADAKPVRRLRPPLARVASWLGAVAVIATAVVLAFSDLPTAAARMRDPSLVLEMTGALLAGVAAVIAAFQLSLPDRARSWALLPLPGLALWLASSSAGCYADWIRYGTERWDIGESLVCVRFIVGVSLPLGISLLLLLRRTYPLAPVPVAATGGLGVAGISAFLLQFFHPFDVTIPDLAMHALAVAIVVSVAILAGRSTALHAPSQPA